MSSQLPWLRRDGQEAGPIEGGAARAGGLGRRSERYRALRTRFQQGPARLWPAASGYPWSLRRRLLALMAALMLAGLALAGTVTYRSLHSDLLQREDTQLDSYAHAAARELLTSGGFSGYGPRIGSGNGAMQPFVEAVDSDGTVTASSAASVGSTALAPPDLPRIPVPPSYSGPDPVADSVYLTAPSEKSGQAPYRVRVSPLAAGPVAVPGEYLVVATPLSDVDATLHSMVWTEVGVTGVVLLLALLVGLWLIRRSLRPLDRMADTAGQIAAGRLDRRVPVEGPRTEVGRLGVALNGMLGRIEGAFAEKEASEARLRRFVGDASHELRTPLTSIRGYAELFRRGADRRPEDLAKAMSRIEEEATRMGFLVDDLLLLARLDQGRPLETAEVNLSGVVADAVDAARVVDPDRRIGDDLEAPILVRGDANRLRQVVDNLLGNVRMHTPTGAPARVRLHADGNDAVLEVEDTGPGIDPATADKVFERFYRADPARTHESGGAGLGLSIVHSIVVAHGGRVEASNRPEGGTRFTVSLPLVSAVPDVPPAPEDPPSWPAPKTQEHPSIRQGIPQPSHS